MIGLFMASFIDFPDARAVGSLADPDGSSALGSAMLWIQNTMVGGVATAIAIITVAVFGLLLMSGRLDVRRGMTVIVGCFLLFGSAAIANGLRSSIGAVETPVDAPKEPVRAVTPPPPPMTRPHPTQYDPYAGASVPG